MTTEELRKLDAEVAEKVMGWTNIRFLRGINDWIGDEPDEIYDRDHQIIHSFSTELMAAWLVIEKLRTLWGCVQISVHGDAGDKWTCFRDDHTSHIEYGDGDTAPLAICRAALKAVAKSCTVHKRH